MISHLRQWPPYLCADSGRLVGVTEDEHTSPEEVETQRQQAREQGPQAQVEGAAPKAQLAPHVLLHQVVLGLAVRVQLLGLRGGRRVERGSSAHRPQVLSGVGLQLPASVVRGAALIMRWQLECPPLPACAHPYKCVTAGRLSEAVRHTHLLRGLPEGQHVDTLCTVHVSFEHPQAAPAMALQQDAGC